MVAINDLAAAESLAHLLKYDSVHGRFPGTVEVSKSECCGGAALVVNGKNIAVTSERNPADLPWGDMNVEIVVE